MYVPFNLLIQISSAVSGAGKKMPVVTVQRAPLFFLPQLTSCCPTMGQPRQFRWLKPADVPVNKNSPVTVCLRNTGWFAIHCLELSLELSWHSTVQSSPDNRETRDRERSVGRGHTEPGC